MQVGEFIHLVRSTLEDDTEFTWQDAELLAWAQLGLNDIAFRTRAYRSEREVETLAGENKFSLDDSVIEIIDLYAGEDKMAHSKWKPKSGSGKPTTYAYDGEMIYLYPTPDNTYTLTAWTFSVPNMPSELEAQVPLPLYTDCLRSFVLHKSYEKLDQTALASYHYQMYGNELDKHRMADKRKTAELNTQLPEIY